MYCDTCGEQNRDSAVYCSHCGARLPDGTPVAARQPAAPGKTDTGGYIERFIAHVSGRYEVIRELGRGGMAIVFLAHDRRLERHVAIKLLPETYSGDEQFSKRFLHEARISAQLSHPNIIQIHDLFHDGGFTYFSMAFVDGVPLARVIRESGPLSPAAIARVGIQVCFALQHAHDTGVVHRDVKPENILINRQRMPIVVDFGIAKAVRGTQLSQTGMFIGTPMYMSPEQIKSGKVDGRSDIYSMGCVLYEMAVGRPPFAGLDVASLMYHQVNEMPQPPHEVNGAVPRELSDLIMQALAKNPDDRIQSARELGRLLHDRVQLGGREPEETTGTVKAATIVAPAQSNPELPDRPPAKAAGLSAPPRVGESPETMFMSGSRSSGTARESGGVPLTPQHAKSSGGKQASPERRPNRIAMPLLAGAMLLGVFLLGFTGYRLFVGSEPPGQVQPGPVEMNPSRPPEPSPQEQTPSTSQTTKQLEPAPAPTTDTRKPGPSVSRAPARTSPETGEPPTPAPRRSGALSPPAEKEPDRTVTTPTDSPPPQPVSATMQETAGREVERTVTGTETRADRMMPEIVWVRIRGGVFAMGDDIGDLPKQTLSSPVHQVTVSPFELSRDEVTVAQYAAFLEATGHPTPPEWPAQLTRPDRPVVFVSWHDAAAYAGWKRARLPSEAEWEYAARGGLDGKPYAWGDGSPRGRANYGNPWEKGAGWTKYLNPTGTFSPNAYGLNDMLGNVWEWCGDWFGPYPTDPVVNPAGPANGTMRVVRGCAWNSTEETLRNAIRGPFKPEYRGPHTGFRVARGG